ncbi:NAD(P)/FAD-dependent oxidoreductase [Yinghuangia sp. ASG 101]|uniref:NAD(P)/FAD-dependent oxidoreductase n=1 Tax=Yinghuangia sp. ASG 101 TaxID=2896848 RepID=UPI001E5291E9|nr:FAD/NAD(P)-binding oxidoreductase [Yinghuangia sp. ASG 101]UGQ11355.1 NAD(P)/FAD-dependent oxidoreductase [Yinghuangia sp. ASG 101]
MTHHEMTHHEILNPTVLIIGAGPSGLRAAAEIAPRITGEVLVLERESAAGGIPRHSDHLGYGIRDLGKFISGPKYAAILRERAEAAGARIVTNAMVTDWAGPRSVNVTMPAGRVRVDAQVVVLATGARERPRPARRIPGDRGQGVYTTGQLQNIVHLKHGTVGRKAVVVGAELVSWSAVLTLRHAGCATVLMTTEYPKPDAYAFFSAPGKVAFGTKVATRTRVAGIFGKPTVEGVEIENLDTGRRTRVACDTVILTGDWIPDNELARAAGIDIVPGSKSPVVDAALRTDKEGVFAIGNLLHPVDTADVAALDGAAVADHVVAHLAGQRPEGTSLPLTAEAPFRWVAPSLLHRNDPAPPRRRLLLWSDRYVPFPKVVLRQQGRIVADQRLWWPAAPGRVFRVPSGMLRSVDWNAGPVTIGLAD